jgi:glycosyltransferase involved in cell wall biosynthesis
MQGVVRCKPFIRGFDFNPRLLGRVWHALRRYDPAVVFANKTKDLRFTGLMARGLGIPLIYRHEIDRPLPAGWYRRIFSEVLPTCILVNSAATKSTILASAPGLDADRVVVVPNGIDMSAFARLEKAALPVPPGAPVVGYVGRFEPRKGTRELALAWPRVTSAIPEAHLVIAGFPLGPAEDREFRGMLDGVPNVHWLGQRNDVPALMRALDVLAFPSHWEGFGLVLIESMAARTPVVATNTSNIPEIVTEGVEGLLVPPRDPIALGDAIVRLLRNPELRTRMGNAGRAKVARCYTLERILDAHEALLDRITSRQR